MVRQLPFAIVYDKLVRRHLDAIEPKHHGLIRRTIEAQLTYDALHETRNRKPLVREVEFAADWELRLGPDNCFRVFYAVDLANRQVQILAIGVKRGNRLFFAGQEIEL